MVLMLVLEQLSAIRVTDHLERRLFRTFFFGDSGAIVGIRLPK